MIFVLNGVDLSRIIAFKGIRHVREDIEGPNSGVSVAGTDILDIVAVRHTWNVRIMPLYAETARQAISSVKRGKMELFTDYPFGEIRKYDVHCSAVPVSMFAAPGGNEIYEGVELVVRSLGDPDEE